MTRMVLSTVHCLYALYTLQEMATQAVDAVNTRAGAKRTAANNCDEVKRLVDPVTIPQDADTQIVEQVGALRDDQ